jgi:hypothetical protein
VPSDGALASSAITAGASAALPSTEVLVTKPSLCAARMPWLRAADVPKPSALTTRRMDAAEWATALSSILAPPGCGALSGQRVV